MDTSLDFDLIIIGGGPGGSTLGALLAKRGLSVAIVEKSEFPRFAIGESLLPYSMDVLKESGVYDKVESSGAFLKKYGAQFIDWQWEHEIGFDFIDGLDRVHGSAFEVQRDQFDALLLEHAKSLGVTVFEGQSVQHFEECENHIEITTTAQTLRGRFLADASGRSGVISRKLKIRKRRKEFNNIAVHGHFSGIKRSPGKREGDIIVGILPKASWSWVIPFKGEISSVGIVVDAKIHKGKDFDVDFIEEALDCHPLFQKMIGDMKSVSPIRIDSNYSEYSEKYYGARWILLGDAASFLDPVFSTGVHMSLQSASFASRLIEKAFQQSEKITSLSEAQSYTSKMETGFERFRNLLRIFYGPDFMGAMAKVMKRPNSRRAFTSVVAGDAWNEENDLFRMGVL